MASSVTVVPSTGHAILMTQGGIGATPGYDAIDVRRMDSSGLGEGVLSPTAWAVSQRAAGANMSVDVAANVAAALVKGDAVTDQGLYRVQPHSTTINVDIATADATNPRNDRIVLEIKDNEHDGSGSNLAQVRAITGTPTGGASLSNLTGAPALPSSAMHLAYVNVPASDTTIADAQILNGRNLAQSYKTVHEAVAWFPADAPSGTYIPRAASAAVVSGTGQTSPPLAFYIDPADYAADAVLRIRFGVQTNATASLNTFTAGLYPISIAGTADTLTPTAGTVVSGTTVAVGGPSASAHVEGTPSSEVALPAAGYYAVCVVTASALPNNSAVSWYARVQVR